MSKIYNNKELNYISIFIGLTFLSTGVLILGVYDIFSFYKIALIYGLIISAILSFFTNSKYNETGLVMISVIPFLNIIFIVFGAKLILEIFLKLNKSKNN